MLGKKFQKSDTTWLVYTASLLCIRRSLLDLLSNDMTSVQALFERTDLKSVDLLYLVVGTITMP